MAQPGNFLSFDLTGFTSEVTGDELEFNLGAEGYHSSPEVTPTLVLRPRGTGVEDIDTLVLRPFVSAEGAMGVTEADDICEAIGGNGLDGRTGSMVAIEADDTSAATAEFEVKFRGTSAPTEAGDTAAGTGTYTLFVRGTVDVTEADDTGLAVGFADVPGTKNWADIHETDDFGSGLGRFEHDVAGTMDATDPEDTAEAVGFNLMKFIGTMAVTEGDDTAAITGSRAQYRLATDSARFKNEQVDHDHFFLLRDAMYAAADPTSTLMVALGLADDATFSNHRVRVAKLLFLQDLLELTETVDLSPERLVAIVDAMVLSGTVTNTLEAIYAIAETLAVEEAASTGKLINHTDIVELTDALSVEIAGYIYAVEATLVAHDSATPVLTALVSRTDSSVFTDEGDVLASLVTSVQDGCDIQVSIRIGDDVFTGWVMNSTSGALSEYSAVELNSLARLGNVYAGASAVGIVELTGTDDLGTDIPSRLATGQLDFGTLKSKNVPMATLSYASDGNCYLRTVTTQSGGETRKKTYRLRARQTQAVGLDVVELAKGVQSNLWQFELETIGGANLEIESLELHPVVFNRISRRS